MARSACRTVLHISEQAGAETMQLSYWEILCFDILSFLLLRVLWICQRWTYLQCVNIYKDSRVYESNQLILLHPWLPLIKTRSNRFKESSFILRDIRLIPFLPAPWTNRCSPIQRNHLGSLLYVREQAAGISPNNSPVPWKGRSLNGANHCRRNCWAQWCPTLHHNIRRGWIFL